MSDPSWYLLKHEDASVFGPISFALLAEWAQAAQISPLDKISTDGTSWMRAPMLPELRMDWLVQVNAQQCYGPTTLEAVREFLAGGEIAMETELINACDGSVHRVGDLPLFNPASAEEEPLAMSGVGTAEVRAGEPAIFSSAELEAAPLRERMRTLEEELFAERRALAELRERYAKLEANYAELLALTERPVG